MADPIPGGGTGTAVHAAAPIAFATGAFADGRVRAHAMLNLEGVTMGHGHLATGVWGEGFMDKRHPHTWGHELMLSVVDAPRLPGGLRWSVSGGKGFAPFGTDDPMNRPALAYPVDHHWSQVLERAVAVGALRWRWLLLEGAVFNGDEPESWDQWPAWDRFGDSWSARATLAPLAGLELQASRARVASPEHRQGAGLRHDMVSASARYARVTGRGRLTALASWAWTDEEGVWDYYSALVEVEMAGPRLRPYLRLERTDRPEEVRVFGDDFRSVRPHNENANLGVTRWATATAGLGARLGPASWPARLEAIAEVGYAHVTRITGVVFDPASFYGRNDLWLFSVAMRVGAGAPVHRMGRYGAADDQH